MINRLLNHLKRLLGIKRKQEKSRHEDKRKLQVEPMEERVLLASDFGDAPETFGRNYPTTLANNGARHTVQMGIGPILGDTVDMEPDGQPSLDGLGDRVNVDDEDGVSFNNLTPGQPSSMTVTVTQASGRVDAWIDFDSDGIFEAKVINNQFVTQDETRTFTFNVPADARPGTTYARVRVSSSGNLPPDGPAADGEVEDYLVVISGTDFGDAPDPPYNTFTLLPTRPDSQDGPSHPITATSPILGTAVDGDADGQPNANATGDDTDGGNDDDGVAFGDIFRGRNGEADVTVTNANGYVNAWIDFNQNGVLDDPGEHVIDRVLMNRNEFRTHTFAVPDTATLGETIARVRISSVDTVTTPIGPAFDGEVEDYQITVFDSYDYGDAPDTGPGKSAGNYATLLADDGARHVIGGPIIGALVDDESDALQTPLADGDDLDDLDDEDGVVFRDLFPTSALPTMAIGQDATITVQVTAASGFVNAWIDFDQDGIFESKIVNDAFVTANSTNAFSFVVPESSASGPTFARVRVSSTAGLGPTGPAPDGEVEDLQVELLHFDLGDAPDTSLATGTGDYRTTILSGGPRHALRGPRLGPFADSEADGLQSPTANGDDADGIDDEDGVTFSDSNTLIAGQPDGIMSVSVTGVDGNVFAWIDFNQDGVFDDRPLSIGGERISDVIDPTTMLPTSNFTPIIANAPPTTLRFAVPGDALAGETIARIRVHSASAQTANGDLTPNGPALDGEVEDYQITIRQLDFGDAINVDLDNAVPIELANPDSGTFGDTPAPGTPAGAAITTLGWTETPFNGGVFNPYPANAAPNTIEFFDTNGDGIATRAGEVFVGPPAGSFAGTEQGGALEQGFIVPFPNNVLNITVDVAVTHPGPPLAFGPGGILNSNPPFGLLDEGLAILQVDFFDDGIPDFQDQLDFEQFAVDPRVTLDTTDPRLLIRGQLNLSLANMPVAFGGTQHSVSVIFANVGPFPAPIDAGATIFDDMRYFVDNVEFTGFAGPPAYATLLQDDGARHEASGVMLGRERDNEADGQPAEFADGDDLNPAPVDDEDGVRFFDHTGTNIDIFTAGHSASLAVDVTDLDPSQSEDAKLYVWADLNNDKTFDDATERVINGASLDATSTFQTFTQDSAGNPLSFNIPTNAALGQTFMRVRLVDGNDPDFDGDVLPTGLEPNGEVEDYVIIIEGYDFGDAPMTGQTLLADDGARHRIRLGGPRFGPNVDNEVDAEPNFALPPALDGLGDDLRGTGPVQDDEDGIVFTDTATPGSRTGVLIAGSSGNEVTLDVQGAAGYVHAWIDMDGDGVFEADEKVLTNEFVDPNAPVIPGGNPIAPAAPRSIVIPADKVVRDGNFSGPRFARLRVFGQQQPVMLPPTGLANDGEVEDHIVNIEVLDFGDAPTVTESVIANNSFNAGDNFFEVAAGQAQRFQPGHRITIDPGLANEETFIVQNVSGNLVTVTPNAGQTHAIGAAVSSATTGSTLGADGARHLIPSGVPNPSIGTAPDGEGNALLISGGLPAIDARGDDSNDSDPLTANNDEGAATVSTTLTNDPLETGNVSTITVANAGLFPSGAAFRPFHIVVNDEIMRVEGNDGVNTLSVVRGAIGTTVVDHDANGAGDVVKMLMVSDGVTFNAGNGGVDLLAGQQGATVTVDLNNAGANGFVHLWVDLNQDNIFNNVLFSDSFATSLNGAVVAGATSLTVNDASGFPATPFSVQVDGENITVTAVAGNTLTTLPIIADHADTAGVAFFGEKLSAAGGVFVTAAAGPAQIASFDVPGSIGGSTFARLRVIRELDTNFGPNGLANNGEVEDHLLTVAGVDYGDAPDNLNNANGFNAGGTSTLDATIDFGSASHVVAGTYLGTRIDSELDHQYSDAADGDDTLGTNDDEDGVLFVSSINDQTQPVGAQNFPGQNIWVAGRNDNTVQVTIGPESGRLFAWLDLDNNGNFHPANDLFDMPATGIPVNPNTTVTLQSTVPSGLAGQVIFARFRVVDDQDLRTLAVPNVAVAGQLSPTDDAFSGEVEDYAIQVVGLDFGDAQDVSVSTAQNDYQTLFANNGAHHATLGPVLGQLVDNELDGQPSANADADDNNGADDEDGVIFDDSGVLHRNLPFGFSVQVTGQPGRVVGWVDFDRNGDFDATELVFDQVLATSLTHLPQTPAIATVPATAIAGPTVARFRIFDQALAGAVSPNGLATAGEVEDHLVVIQPLDYGDAPDTYQTSFAGSADPARHQIVAGPTLGVVRDDDADGQPTVDATGDDSNPFGSLDDEDGVTFFNQGVQSNILTAGFNASLQVEIGGLDIAGNDGLLYAWMDLDGDGTFNDNPVGVGGERIYSAVPVNNGTNNLVPFALPFSTVSGDTFVRVRVVDPTHAAIGPIGLAANGEVEDYQVSVQQLDFGDAPDTGAGTGAGNYRTLSTDGGPQHVIAGPRLGTLADPEANGQPTIDSLGDDATDDDDEDGVIFTTGLFIDEIASADVTVTNANGRVDAWIDFNNDGVFDNSIGSNEKIIDSQTVAAGATQAFSFTVPVGSTLGNTVARFRVSSSGSLQPGGAALDGEVEDHQVLISSVDFGDAPDTYGTTVANDGARHAIGGPRLGFLRDQEGDANRPLNGFGDDGFRLFGLPQDGTSPNQVAEIDHLNGVELSRLNLPETVSFTSGLAFDGQSLWFINGTGLVDTLYQIDADTGLVTDQDIIANGNYDGIAALNGTVFILDSAANTITSFNPTTDATALVPIAGGLDISATGMGALINPDRLLVIDNTGRAQEIDPVTGATTATFNPGAGFSGIAVVAGEIYLSTSVGQSQIQVVNRNGGPIRTVSLDNTVVGLAGHPETTDALGNLLDDEDSATVNGVDVSNVEFVAGQPTTISVNVRDVTSVGFVQAWVDRDRDGTFDHPSEMIANEVITTPTGVVTFPYTPHAGSLGDSYLRLRVSSAGNLGPTGAANDGEVEDYRINVISPGYNNPILNFNGLTFSGVNPPDTVGDAGPNHYVQSTNGVGSSPVAIFDKTGATLDTFVMDTLGGPTGGGDPIVLYDHLADRWLLAEFSDLTNDLIVHISTGPVPTGNAADWFTYTFNTPEFPDYPKISVWPDAYYVTTNESAPAVYALDRTNMLTNGPLRAHQRLPNATQTGVTPLSGFGFQALTPADLDGPAPPVGSPAYFMRHVDDEVHNGANNTADFLEVYQFITDFNVPGNSRIDRIASIPVQEFSSELCGLTGASCFEQPGGVDPAVDPLREVIMWRLQYRHFPDGTPNDPTPREVLVGNFTADFDGENGGGVRWFELNKNVGPAGWQLKQEGEVSIGDDNRFMGAISMDGVGNIALGYNIIDSDVPGGLRYVGRRATDPLGTMTMYEETIVNGVGSNPSNRWGDYSAMSVDPADDRTFWFTGEFANSGQWGTRIAAFAFDNAPSQTVQDFGITVLENNGNTLVAEGGATDTYAVALSSTPVGPVEITATSDGQTEVSIDGSNFFNSVTFTLNSVAPQFVTVRAIDDGDFEFGNHISVIRNEVSLTNDPNFPAAPLLNVTATVGDNDTLTSPLVGVDFGTDSLTPINWTRIGSQTTPVLFNDLIDESSATTPIDLRLIDSGGAIVEQLAQVDPLTIPTHVQSLVGIDDNVSIGATDTLTAIWSDLSPAVEYELWVFAQTDSVTALSQDVSIVGDTTINFTQTFLDTGVAINDESGSSARTLDSYPEVLKPDATGQITITIAANVAGSADVVLSGLAIRPILPEIDFGDAPDTGAGTSAGNYQTLASDNGPSHLIINGSVQLGPAIDSEADGQPNAIARGDDTTNSNDEDGVTFTTGLIPGQQAGVDVLINGTGLLDAWIDFNADGDFNDAGEKIANSAQVSNQVGRLFATNRDVLENEIIEIDPATGNTIRTFQSPQTVGVLNGLAFDGINIWYLEGIGGNTTQDILYRIDADSGAVQQQFDLQALLGADFIYDGMAFLDGRLYIQESSNNRIQVFDPLAGTFQPIPIVPGVPLDGGLGAIEDPTGGSDHKLVATDRVNKRIYIMDATTGLVTSSFTHTIRENTGIAVLNGEIYAADLDADITVFDQAGNILRMIQVTPSVASTDISLRSLAGAVGAVQGPRINGLTFNVPTSAIPGSTFARFRVSTAGNLAPVGPAADGEVEDYQVGIGLDFGDAPDLTSGTATGDYQTLAANNGPSHALIGPRLGLQIDHEADGQPSIGAVGDNNAGTNDEDGVTFAAMTKGQNSSVTVNVTNEDGRVDGWIDFNGDGDFADAGEKILDSVLVTAGASTSFNFSVPLGAVSNTAARFRVSRSGNLTASSAAPHFEGGEVEDYQVLINSPNVADGIGVVRGASIYKDANNNGIWDGTATDLWNQFGTASDEFFFGDWNGDGRDKVGVRRGHQIFLDINGNGDWDGAPPDRVGYFGLASDELFVGDFDGDGDDEIALRRGSMVFIDANGNLEWDPQNGDLKYTFGADTDTFLVGDWSGDGKSKIGVHRGGRFYFDLDGNGAWNGTASDRLIVVGNNGDVAMVGDWDGDGVDTWGLRRGATYYRGGTTASGFLTTTFGMASDTLILGDWGGDGRTKLGIQRGNQIFLDGNGDGTYSSPAVGDVAATFGNPGDTLVVGKWTSALTAAQGPANSPVADVATVNEQDLAPIVNAAIDVFASAGLRQDQIERLQQITVRVDDLGGSQLGRFDGRAITIDDDAAGHGWFVDSTPNSNDEFTRNDKDRLFATAGQSAADGNYDLLSALLHEMGHALGLADDHSNANSGNLMNAWLENGERRLPSEGDLAEIMFGK